MPTELARQPISAQSIRQKVLQVCNYSIIQSTLRTAHRRRTRFLGLFILFFPFFLVPLLPVLLCFSFRFILLKLRFLCSMAISIIVVASFKTDIILYGRNAHKMLKLERYSTCIGQCVCVCKNGHHHHHDRRDEEGVRKRMREQQPQQQQQNKQQTHQKHFMRWHVRVYF